MTRALLLATLLVLAAALPAAEEIEALDADFLDYLADMEADDDNWTLLESSHEKPVTEQAETRQPAAKAAAARKPSKEAAKTAVDER